MGASRRREDRARTMRIVFLIALCLASIARGDDPAPQRGRDPFVFRCILDDKPRSVVIALAPSLWLAYDPATCALFEAFGGGVELRGKVYDFSQDNSRALPPFHFRQRSLIFAAVDPPRALGDPLPDLPEGCAGAGVAMTPAGLKFDGDGASLTLPALDLRAYANVMLRFDERSRRGPFRVEVSDDGGATFAAQWFHSTLHRDRDDAWQDNMKRVAPHGDRVVIRVTQEHASDRKELRSLKVQGDRIAWSATPTWRGYRRTAAGATLLYDLALPDGRVARVEESPEVVASPAGTVALRRAFRVHLEGPPAQVALDLEGETPSPWTAGGSGRIENGALLLDAPGECALECTWSVP